MFLLAQSPVGSRYGFRVSLRSPQWEVGMGFRFSLAQTPMGSRNGFLVFNDTVSNGK